MPTLIRWVAIAPQLAEAIADASKLNRAYEARLGEDAELIRKVIQQNFDFLNRVPRNDPR